MEIILPDVSFVCAVFDMVAEGFEHALSRSDVTGVKHLVAALSISRPPSRERDKGLRWIGHDNFTSKKKATAARNVKRRNNRAVSIRRIVDVTKTIR